MKSQQRTSLAWSRLLAAILPLVALPALGVSSVTALPGTGDTFYAAVKATPGRWVAMRDGKTIRSALDAHPEFTIYGDPRAITSAWSGGARRGAKFWGTGGGHYDCSFNGVYEVDLETGKTSIPIAPSRIPPERMQAIRDSWTKNGGGWLGYSQMGIHPSIDPGDGLGPSIHTYQMAYVGEGETFAVAGRIFDLKSGRMHAVPLNGGPDTNGVSWGSKYVGTNWNSNHWDVTVVDPAKATGTVTYLDWPYRRGAGDRVNFDQRTYLAVIGDTLYAIKTTTMDPAAWPPPIVWRMALPIAAKNNTDLVQRPFVGSWSAEDMAGLQITTQVMDPETNTVYLPAKDWSYFLTWQPLTNKLGKVVLQGGLPATQVNAAYGRLQWYRERGVITLINSIDEAIYAVSVK